METNDVKNAIAVEEEKELRFKYFGSRSSGSISSSGGI